MKNPKVKSSNGNHVTSINKGWVVSKFKSGAEFLVWVKEKGHEHIYASFNKNDEAVKGAFESWQPKAETPAKK